LNDPGNETGDPGSTDLDGNNPGTNYDANYAISDNAGTGSAVLSNDPSTALGTYAEDLIEIIPFLLVLGLLTLGCL